MAARVTITDLADELGVSRQTISNVLNAPHRVKEETRLRVAQAIEARGYRPNQAARQLRSHISRNIGMRLQPAGDGINGAILTDFLYGLTAAAHRHGYRITLFGAETDEQEIARYRELTSEGGLDGFILTATHHGDLRAEWLQGRGIPFVTFGRPWREGNSPLDISHPWVDVDGSSGTWQATEHLIAQGHQNIGFIGWPAGSGVGDDRHAGWKKSMEAHFRTTCASAEYRGFDSTASGSAGAATLLQQGATAFVCASDTLALGASGYLRQSDRLDLATSVIGFDDTPVAAALGLSSVAQPVQAASDEAMRIMMDLLGSTTSGPEQLLLEPVLKLRDLQPFSH